MSEHENPAAPDPADTTERRDWDLPPDAEEEASRADVPAPDRPPAPAADATGPTVEAPPDESEKRDWDVP